jgi:tetratricopeptide (TPR) repeat protein
MAVLAAALLAPAGCRSKGKNDTLQKQAGSAPPAVEARPAGPAAGTLAPTPEVPPPALALSIELSGDEFYGSDPLPITVRLVSPKARRQSYRQLAQGPGDSAVEWPKCSPQWPGAMSFILFAIQADGQRQPAGATLDWPKLLVPDDEPVGIGNPSRVWMIPAEADLPPGRYVLQAAWNGRDLADASSLPADGTLRGELEFELVEAKTAPQRALHLERLAGVLYARLDFAKARDLGRQAINLDPATFDNQRLATWMMVADCSVGLNDLEAAIGEYKELLGRLAEKSERGASIQRWIDILTDIKAKEDVG